jgi:integrase
MATIVKRIRHGKPVYQVRIRSAAGTASATFDKKADATEWAAKAETAIRRGTHIEEQKARTHMVADALDRYLESPRFKKLAGQVDRKAQINWWKDQYGSLTLAQFQPDKIAEGRDALTAEGKAPATVNRYLAALSAAMKNTVRELGWLAVNPVSKVDRLPEDNARERALTGDERTALLAACRSKDLHDLVLLALCTAGRRGELLGLAWGDVDLKQARATFRDTKSGETRAVALVEPALSMMKARNKIRHIGSDWVFPSRSDPKQPAKMRGAFENAVQRAKIGDFVFHQLRHSALTMLAESGATLSELMAVSGHRTMTMVKRYQHICENHTATVLERMAEQHLRGAS